MKKYFLIICLSLFICTLSSCGTPKFDSEDLDNVYVQINVKSYGKINLKLDSKSAPITVKNFVKLASESYYDDVIFHRVIENFMIQTGGYKFEKDELIETKQVGNIKGEFSRNGVNNQIHHELGVISMARASGFNSGSSQFFLCSTDCGWLDGEYAAFGKTTDDKSNDVILNISHKETYIYQNFMADFPVKPIRISSIKLSNNKF